MSGDSYRNYESRSRAYEAYRSDDADVRRQAEEARVRRVVTARAEAPVKKTPPPKRDVAREFDSSLVRSKFTRPAEGTRAVTILLVDNSGSNKEIARKIRESSAYLLDSMRGIDPDAHQLALSYFSDHCDGELIMQDVDFVSPNQIGDKTLLSTTSQVQPANGGDDPEAIECAFHAACGIDFGGVQTRHLILVTDVVAHGMGLNPDRGCTEGRKWKEELKRVRDTFSTFSVIGSGNRMEDAELQKQFLTPERLPWDYIPLSHIRDQRYRLGIVGNAVLFLMARNRDLSEPAGKFPTVEMFLSMLYEKWLHEPIFGKETDINARDAIKRFLKYIDAEPAELERMLGRIIPPENA